DGGIEKRAKDVRPCAGDCVGDLRFTTPRSRVPQRSGASSSAPLAATGARAFPVFRARRWLLKQRIIFCYEEVAKCPISSTHLNTALREPSQSARLDCRALVLFPCSNAVAKSAIDRKPMLSMRSRSRREGVPTNTTVSAAMQRTTVSEYTSKEWRPALITGIAIKLLKRALSRRK